MKPPLVIGLIVTILISSPVAFADKYDDAIKSHQDEINGLPSTAETTVQNKWITNVATPNSSSGSSIPSGMIAGFVTSTCPSGWSEFKIPGRVLVGEGALNDGTLYHNYTRGQTGGKQLHRLSVYEMPHHNHGLVASRRSNSHGSSNYYIKAGNDDTAGVAHPATQGQGGNGMHENRMPYYTVKYCHKD